MNKNILLVEDEKIIREMYQHAFSKRGYEIDTAADGQEAMDKLTAQKAQYELILLDIMIPKIDGISILRKIKAADSPLKNIPVILLTNLGQEELIKESIKLGAIEYLIKSNILPMQVVDRIESLFSSLPATEAVEAQSQ